MASMIKDLEREWKKERDPGNWVVLRDWYLELGIEPEPELKRLEEEVEHDVRRQIVEEVSGEHGNLDAPWGVHVLTADEPEARYRLTGGARPEHAPDYTTPDGLALWIANWGIHGTGKDSKRHFVVDFPPEWAEKELRAEFGDDAEFVTVYDGGNTEYLADSGGREPSIWRRVREYQLGERECPFKTWDPEEHEETSKDIVKVSDTWYGERPGKACRLCEERVGEEHGYLYLGEEAQEVVYKKLVPEVELTTTVDAPEVEEAVTEAFEAFCASHELDSSDVFYEHGQWFARANDRTDEERERTFSVVDTQDGFDFEEI